jgi:hypothetical protein
MLLRSELLGCQCPSPISPDKATQLEQMRGASSPSKKILRFKSGAREWECVGLFDTEGLGVVLVAVVVVVAAVVLVVVACLIRTHCSPAFCPCLQPCTVWSRLIALPDAAFVAFPQHPLPTIKSLSTALSPPCALSLCVPQVMPPALWQARPPRAPSSPHQSVWRA